MNLPSPDSRLLSNVQAVPMLFVLTELNFKGPKGTGGSFGQKEVD